MLSLKIRLLSVGFLFLFSIHSRAETVYKFGVVPQFEPRKLLSTWDPIIKQLKEKTGANFTLVIPNDIPAFEAAFKAGDFDFAYMNPYHAVMAQKAQKYRPFARDGAGVLYGILVAAKNNSINSIEDLKKNSGDNKIAFPSPNALGASLLMRADLSDRLKIHYIPIWAKTHTSAYLNVITGQAIAAGGVQSTFEKESDEIKNNLKIIYETKHLPTHPIAAHPRVDKKFTEKVFRALVEISKTQQGAQQFHEIPINKLVKSSFKDYEFLAKLGLEKHYIDEAK